MHFRGIAFNRPRRYPAQRRPTSGKIIAIPPRAALRAPIEEPRSADPDVRWPY
jgi:hypothetical protein